MITVLASSGFIYTDTPDFPHDFSSIAPGVKGVSNESPWHRPGVSPICWRLRNEAPELERKFNLVPCSLEGWGRGGERYWVGRASAPDKRFIEMHSSWASSHISHHQQVKQSAGGENNQLMHGGDYAWEKPMGASGAQTECQFLWTLCHRSGRRKRLCAHIQQIKQTLSTKIQLTCGPITSSSARLRRRKLATMFRTQQSSHRSFFSSTGVDAAGLISPCKAISNRPFVHQ